MGANVVFFAWNRSIPGREQLSAQHFQDFVGYLTESQQAGAIASFDIVFLDPHGGDLNGFFLIRADSAKLAAFIGSDKWNEHMTRAGHHLEGSGAVTGATNEAVMERMKLWTSLIPS